MRTGIFFYYQEGNRLRDFPNALEGILERESVFFYDAFYPSKPTSSFDLNPVSCEALLQVHSSEMIEEVKRTGVFEGALLSASGTIRAAEKIWRGEIDNAFVFTGYGDHHAGPDFFGGGCYFNGAAIAIQELRKGYGVKRFAIIDTDAHHGDGTQGEYGDIGLTPEVHILLVRELKKIADEVSKGRFVIVLCGGSQRDLAHYLIPRMIEVLAEVQIPAHR